MPRKSCQEIEQELRGILSETEPDEREVSSTARALLDCRKREDIRNAVNFTIVIPKVDNSGYPVRREIIEQYKDEITFEFGGLTAIDVKGCLLLEDEKKIQCEDNMLVMTSTDKMDFPEKKIWVDEFTRRVGRELGQDSIYLTSEEMGREFVPGKRRERVPDVTYPWKR